MHLRCFIGDMLYFDPHSTRAGTAGFEGFFFFLQSFQFAQDIFLFTDRKTRSPSVFFPWISRKGKRKAYKTWFIQNNIYIEGESYPSDCL